MSLNVFPNPASEETHVEFILPDKSDFIINVFDLNGKIVYSKKIEGLGKGLQEVILNSGKLNGGAYLLQLVAGSKTAVSRIVVVK